MKKNLIIVIAGPTASGKTSLGIDIALALNGEIISADSMQIYKKMDIATAKPTDEERSIVKHHLIDFLDIGEEFSVAKYKELAIQSIEDILSRKKTPIIVGGTGLYIDCIINNTEFFDYEKNDVRETLEKEAEEKGIDALFEQLKKVDIESANTLNINDKKRIIRALEVYYSTGKTITQQKKESHLNESPYRFCVIGLNAHNREFLYNRINQRVDIMLKDGLLEEAQSFFSSDASLTAKQAIGYKELKPYFDKEISLADAVENLKRETRRYAKRQLTWFRKTKDINWIYIDSGRDILNDCLKIIDKYKE
ncbi:MAG: tRNA (adenosine(37)-N6)-dimethylallyltransferase MiaA [Clostridia bacterium]|nr:tRNA (adenosine(37)-N6)-dimethylallyltransferase MiaA [Clostridia bacterium]